MKLLSVIFLVFGLLLSACDSKEHDTSQPSNTVEEGKSPLYTISGTLAQHPNATVVLLKVNRRGADTLAVATTSDNGQYELIAQAEADVLYNFICEDLMTMVFTDNTTIGVSHSESGWSFENSNETQLYYDYNQLNSGFVKSFSDLQKEYQLAVEQQNNAKIQAIQLAYDSVYSNAQTLQQQFIVNHSPSYTAYMALMDLLKSQNVDAHVAFLQELKPKYKDADYPFASELIERIELIERLAVGAVAPDFTLPTPSGEPISLSDLKGKYVLIDFWASWCGPCVAEIPNLKAAYSKYAPKGFEILGVSLDKSKENWVEAIKKYDMSWPQVSDLKHWDSMVNPLYNISGIPFTVLVDPAGKIVAKNLRGKALELKLEEVL